MPLTLAHWPYNFIIYIVTIAIRMYIHIKPEAVESGSHKLIVRILIVYGGKGGVVINCGRKNTRIVNQARRLVRMLPRTDVVARESCFASNIYSLNLNFASLSCSTYFAAEEKEAFHCRAVVLISTLSN